ncbi:MAG TPA: glycosyltransferase [Mycobacteriales bacterium]
MTDSRTAIPARPRPHQVDRPAGRFPLALSVVVPTRNEAGNVTELLRRLDRSLGRTDAEVLFVDDSDDDTPEVVAWHARTAGGRVRLLHRPAGERAGGLGGAVVAGLRAARGDVAVVMDGDLQHPADVVPELLATAAEGHDLVVASRYTATGDAHGLAGRWRVLVSLLCTVLVRLLFPRRLRAVSDPMSGFFAVRPGRLDLDRLRPTGYKILLEIIGRSGPLRTAEVPFAFQPRLSGESKASPKEGVRLLTQVLRLRLAALAGGTRQVTPAPRRVDRTTVRPRRPDVRVDQPTRWIPAPRRAVPSRVDDATRFVPGPPPGWPEPDRRPPVPPAAEPAWSDPAPSRRVVWAGRVALLLTAVGVAWLQPGGWLAVVAALLTLALARAAGWQGRQARIIAVAVAVYLAAVDYLSWRLSVLSWVGWWIGVPLFLAELHAALHSVGLHVTLWPQRVDPVWSDLDPSSLPIFVFVPTVDEGPRVLEPTLRAALAARARYLREHPWAEVTIVVCNDGRVAGAPCSPDVERLAYRLGVHCVTRTVGGGAKAGNIEHARQLVGATGDALVVIFDADQVAHEDFLVRTVPPFADRGIGWVQTGQYYSNRENPVARWADDQQSLFYRLLCPGKADHDSAFICGTNVVLRARALDSIGGLPTDSVTEDFAASIRLAPHWRSIYLPDVLATGLGPVDLRSYLRQQERWARGTLMVLRTHWKDLVLPRRGGLRAQQRLQYGLAVTHYLSGIRDVVFLAAPVIFLLTGASGVRGATLGTFLFHFVPYYLLTIVGFWHAAWRLTTWRSIVLGFGSFPALLRATWLTLTKGHGRFTITPKVRADSSAWRAARPHLAALAACGLALVVAVVVRHDPAYWLAAAWLVYLGLTIGAFLGLVAADSRAARGVPARRPVPAPWDPHPARAARTASRGRRPVRRPVPVAAALAATAGVLLVGAFVALNPTPATTVDAAPLGVPAPPRTGLSGVTAAERAAVTTGSRAGTVDGWTQEVSDRFDADRAEAVAAAGGTPWLTLVLSRDGKPTLEASLTAIGNGVDDDVLRSWAGQLADYGRPVYLTVLPAVDRNYAATSAVTRGGIPADSPRAWSRIRALFRAAGATNVAWVWSPADPAADRAYRPPAAEIDLVAVTLYQYPTGPRLDPARRLAGAARAHPGTPLLVDVSVAGPAARRTAWLRGLAAAVEARDDVAAVTYHVPGPYPDLTPPGAAAWRPDRDPAVRSALSGLFDGVGR